MRRAGFFFRYAALEPVGGPLLDGLPDIPGGGTPAEAPLLRVEKREGYGQYKQFETSSNSNSRAGKANIRYYRSLSPKAQRRYDYALAHGPSIKVRFPGGGVDTAPSRGCDAYASRVLFGSVALDDFRVNAVALVNHLLGLHVLARPAVKAGTRRWARCMQDRNGHTFKYPGDAVNWLVGQYYAHGTTQRLRHLEIQLAMQSTSCAYRVGLAQRYASTSWKVIGAMPLAWYRDIVRVKRAELRARKKASAV